MDKQNQPIYANEEKLVQNALLHLQSLFVGNGFQKDSIKILSHNVTKQSVSAGTYLELKQVMAEKTVPGKIVVGELMSSRETAMASANAKMVAAANNSAIKAKITALLLDRPDKGFGLKQQTIPIDFLKHDFTWHEPCQVCKGTSRSTCQKCQGRKLETCIKCGGRSMMMCPMCRGTGLIQGNKCNRCHGKRFIPCDGCRSSGLMSCRACNATGASKCTACNAVGFKSFVLSLTAQALTYFEYDAKSMPKNAADAFETYGSTLVVDHSIHIKGRMADEKENSLGANYEVEYPAGEIVFKIGDKEIKGHLFGYKSRISGFPNILDKILSPVVQDLEDAAKNIGSVADKIKKATKYKIIARAYLLLQKTNPKNATRNMIKTYDVGLSGAMAEKIINLAYTTTAHITRKPRIIGLIIGLCFTALIASLYYWFSIRGLVFGIPVNVYLKLLFEVILDLVPIIIGGILTTFCIKKTAAKSIQTALGHLVAKDQKHKLVAKTLGLGMWGYIGAGAISMLMLMLISYETGITPQWFLSFKNFFY